MPGAAGDVQDLAGAQIPLGAVDLDPQDALEHLGALVLPRVVVRGRARAARRVAGEHG
jgi:hypothetical protein